MTMENNNLSGEKSRRTFDPVKRAEDVADIVCKGDLRKYYRFRPARFYGGIATSDCVGCSLRCIFCWSWNQVVRPERFGQYYSPRDVAERLINIARKKRYRQMRISGNEPTIGRDHLIRVLELIPKDTLFILETNGILIGNDKTYAADLAGFHNVYARVSIKGCTNDQFSLLTGADSHGFDLQIQAVENLYRAGVRVQPAVMVSFSSPEDIHALQSKLGGIDKGLKDIEIEELVLYGEVEKRLQKANIPCENIYYPDNTPPNQI
jgi:uncharacterized Fe-S cluster-containing radical SAM superfamily protein